MCSQDQCYTIADVPVSIPCEKSCYKGPYRKEPPHQMNFIVQWYVEKYEHQKQFLLSYYDYDATMELKDLTLNRRFLRRMKVDTVTLNDLYLGGKLMILSRPMIIMEYADNLTQDYVEPKTERAFLMVMPEAIQYLPSVVKRLEGCFRITGAKMAMMTKALAFEFSKLHESEEYHLEMVKKLDSQNVVAFLVMGENAMEKMACLVGNDDPKEAQLSNHNSLRALYGLSKINNGFYFSQTKECLHQDASYFFSDCPCCTLPSTVSFKNTTCCLIKPHAMKEGIAGRILSDISACFKISGLGIFWLTKAHAEEFLVVYKAVFTELDFAAMVDEYCCGPSLVLEITGRSDECPENNQGAFRSYCGPIDPAIARKISAGSLRARYGLTKAKNAIHCTDLPEDTKSELEYFFRILDRRRKGVKSVY